MNINAHGRSVSIINGKVFVDGHEVLPQQGGRSDKQESDASRGMRSALEARYPNVSFKGDCSKIKVESGVVLEAGVVIEQNDDAVIEITGQSVLAEGVYVSTPVSQDISLSSVSMSGSGISVVSVGRGTSINSNNSSDPRGVRIDNTTIGKHAEVSGLSIILSNSKVSDKCRITGQGSGSINITEGDILAGIVSAGSGDITIKESKISAAISLSGSGEIDIKNSSTVSGSISVAGSGDVTVSGSVVEASGSLSVTGSGEIKAKDCTVSRPYSVVGSKSIRI